MKLGSLVRGAEAGNGSAVPGMAIRVAAAALSLLFVLAQAGTLEGAPPTKGARRLSSTSRARREAIGSIPWQRLDEQSAADVRHVVEHAGLFRRLPAQSIECSPAFFNFLIEHPDVVVNIWRVLKLSDVRLTRVGEGQFSADDRSGTKGELKIVFGDENLHVIYGEGRYEGPLLARPVKGQCVLIVSTEHTVQADGRPLATCRVDAFLHLENVGIDVLARTFQHLLGRTADHNLRETAQFVGMLYQAAELNQAGVQQVAASLTDVAEEDRRRFAELAEEVAVRAALLASEEAAAQRAAQRSRVRSAPR